MWQKSLLVAYSFDTFLYFSVTSAPSSVAGRGESRFEIARLYARNKRKKWRFVVHVLSGNLSMFWTFGGRGYC
jgi:hypothetical protein